MSWLGRWRRLRALGVLGMNRRNAECILDLNPRRLFPLVDSKLKMRDLCESIGVPTPAPTPPWCRLARPPDARVGRRSMAMATTPR